MTVTNDTQKAQAGQPITKPAPGSSRLQRQVRKLAAKGAIEKSITAVKAEDSRADREIRFHCYLRDKRKCRAFGTLLLFDTENLKKKAQNHHIQFLSAGGSNAPSNRITLGPKAHQMIHNGELDCDGNADEAVTFRSYTWNTDGSRKLLCEWESQP